MKHSFEVQKFTQIPFDGILAKKVLNMQKIIDRLKKIWHWFDPLFPEQDIYTKRLSFRYSIVALLILTIVITLLASLMPLNEYIGFDWTHFWGKQNIPAFYPPWTVYLVKFITYPMLIGITIASFIIATYQRSNHMLSSLAALLSFPLIWTVFLGQLEGWTVLGMLYLPWLIPMVLVKPQVSVFGLGARRSYIIAFFIFFCLSLLFWGNWPAKMFAITTYYSGDDYPQDIGLGIMGLPIFLSMLWFSRGDMDMLMACGAFISPHLVFYNLLPLTPAVARLKPGKAIIAMLISFTPLLSNWLGEKGWLFGWGFVFWLWVNLAIQRYPNMQLTRWIKKRDSHF